MLPEALASALDEVIERYGGGAWSDEIVRARTEYAAKAGRVFEDDDLYEARSTSFLEWYACERPLAEPAVPPVVLELRRTRRAELRAWATSHRSLFTVEQLAKDLRLRDLLGGGSFRVPAPESLAGVAPRDVLELRLVPWEGDLFLGRTFLHHPAATRPAILAHARRIQAEGGSRLDVVAHVASLRVRSDRYRHVAPERVYDADSPDLPARP